MDYVRRQIWDLPEVAWYYAQNILLFVERDYLGSNSLLQREAENTPSSPLSLVHPVKYVELALEIRLAQEINELVPLKDSFILVDDFGVEILPGRKGSPFLERDGVYWGKPANDDEAIRELQRMRQTGSAFVIITWHSFWWLDYYVRFYQYLRSNFRSVRENDCVIAFDLRSTV